MALSRIKTWLGTDAARRVLYIAGGVLLFIVISLTLKSCYDNSVVDKHETEVKAEVLEKTQRSNDSAADQRAKDTIDNTKKDEARKDVISKTVDEIPSAASRALGCERLRQSGYDTSDFPTCG